MRSILSCNDSEIDLRNLNLSANWYNLNKAALFSLSNNIYELYLKKLKDDFNICCDYSHFHKNKSINLDNFCNLINNITPFDHMYFTILGYVKCEKIKNKRDLLRLLDEKIKNKNTTQIEYRDETKKLSITDAKNYILRLLNKQIFFSGIPEGPDLQIDFYILQTENDFAVEFRISILGYCLDFTFNEQINSWLDLIELLQNNVPPQNAAISYDAFPNIHEKYHSSNHYVLNDNSSFLICYDWGMFIPVDMFNKLGGEERAKKILESPIIKYKQNMVWIFLDKPLYKIKLTDKIKLKKYYNDVLLPGYYMASFRQVRCFGEMIVENDENISLYVEPIIKKILPDNEAYELKDYSILFKHGNFLMYEGYKDYYGIS